MKTLVGQLSHTFKILYGKDPLLCYAPGRINLIGEHTDYNNGFVLPAAIDKAVYVAVAKRSDDCINLFAVQFSEHFSVALQDINPLPGHWSNYVTGVVAQCKDHGVPLSGFDMVIDGDVPAGAGLSSSAAMECAVIVALNLLYNAGMALLDMTKMAQRAEHLYAGVQCGIMDQFASMHGKKDHALLLDCETLSFELIPVVLPGYQLVLFNTNVKHSLASSAYNERRQQCEQGVAWIREKHAAVRSLRDVTMEMLTDIVLPRDTLIHRRCKYVVEENGRLHKACGYLRSGNMAAFGQLLYATHHALSTEYEVSCAELDFLVDRAKQEPAVAGARMMGGGFGGCTLNLVKTDQVDAVVERITDACRQNNRLSSDHYIVNIIDGAGYCK